MSLLNFEPSGPIPKGERKSLRIFLGIGALVGVIALGSTLAASINLNDSGPVEFGQGVTQTTACDSQVEVIPISSFVNADGGGDFKFSAITLSDLDGTEQTDASDEGCVGSSFTIKTYDSDGEQLLPTYEISVVSEGVFTSLDGDINSVEEDSENISVTLTFDGTLIDAESVYRITIESSDSADSPDSDIAITWDDQGATTPSSGGSTTYAQGSAVSTIPSSDPVRDGFSFGGWWTGINGNGEQVTSGSYTPASPYSAITFYAKWTEDNTGGGTQYSVSAYSLSGSNTQTVSSGYSSSETKRTVSLTRSGDNASDPGDYPGIYGDNRSTLYITDVWSITNVTDMWGPNDYGPWGEYSYYVLALTRDGNASFDIELKPNLPAGEYSITIKVEIDGNETTLLTYTVTVN